MLSDEVRADLGNLFNEVIVKCYIKFLPMSQFSANAGQRSRNNLSQIKIKLR